MKKTITIVMLIIMIMMVGMTAVNAATSSSIANDLYAIGSKFGMTSADKVKIERYLSDHPVSDADANSVFVKAQEAEKIMKDSGTTDYKSLPASVKNQLKSIANEAASIIGITLTFKSGSIEIYKDGKLIETVSSTTGKLPYTGNDINIALVVSVVAVIALSTAVISKKKFANAQ